MVASTDRRPRSVRHAFCVLLVLGVAACSSQEPSRQPPLPSPTPPTAAPAPSTAAPTGPTWALTGLPATGDLLERPALAVKIENSAAARPQSGLVEADVVYEELVEGGLTRFAVVFHSAAPELVGPIRSLRPMDASLVGPLRGLFVYSGGIPAFKTSLREVPVQDLSADRQSYGYTRVTTKRAPHNLYGKPAAFWKLAKPDFRSSPQPLFTYGDLASTASTAPARVLDLTFSPVTHVRYTFDADSGSYLRSQGGPFLDPRGRQVSAENVIVQAVTIRATGYRDPGGVVVPETMTVGRGRAWVVRDGVVVAGSWSKSSAADPTVYRDETGAEIALAPGRTWVALLPDTQSPSFG